MSELHTPTIAILASGEGSTAEAFICATQESNVNAEVGLVICNNPPEKAGIYSRIDRLNDKYGLDIETVEINSRTHPAGNVGRGQTLQESSAICERINQGNFAHVALMGYMKKIRGDLLEEYGWLPSYNSIYQSRMLNSHPGPLPETADTFGVHASQRVLDLGMWASKYTIHLVAAEIDEGPKIFELPIHLTNDETAQSLLHRTRAVEKGVLPHVIDKFLKRQSEYFGDS